MLIISTAHASNYQSTYSMRVAVEKFLKDELTTDDFTIGNIDKRLKLKNCSNNIEVRFPQYADQLGRTTVQLSCNQPKVWKILVSVNIRDFKDVLAIKHSLPRGSAIQKSDLKTIRKDVSKIQAGYFTDINQVTNMIAQRAIKAGRILSPAILKPRRLVNQGDDVLILAETGNLSIRVKGKALMNGSYGQRIRVKNVNSRRIFQATVISNGLVKVNM